MARKKAEAAPDDDDADSGWQSSTCTKSRCGVALDFGAGIQFLDEKGNQQRYCWKDWVKYNSDPKRFPGASETNSTEGL